MVPFNDLLRGVQLQQDALSNAISRVLQSGWFVMGPEHDALERELAEFVGVKFAINVGNGTDALEMSLSACGVRSGDLVLTVANAGAYTSTAALLLDAEPVYVDIDPTTLQMSVDAFKATLAQMPKKPKVVVVTHLYGALAPVKEIISIAHSRGIFVIEDCSQSLGSSINGKQCGSFGDISTTSFYPTKNLGALGDGGAIFTDNDELALELKSMRQYGWSSKYSITGKRGKNSRLDEIQAAILRVKLPLLNQKNDQRRRIHQIYEATENHKIKMVNRSSSSFNAHLGVATVHDREDVISKFEKAGIKTEIHYPVADHKQNFPEFKPRKTNLEVTEWATRHVLSLPLFPELTSSEIGLVVQTIQQS